MHTRHNALFYPRLYCPFDGGNSSRARSPGHHSCDEDASIVERELQDEPVEFGYYDVVVSRNLEARKNADPETTEEHAAKERRWDTQVMHAGAARLQQTAMNRHPNQAGLSRPPHPQPNGGSGEDSGPGPRRETLRPSTREYDLDGELSERGFEIDELD